jgi:hypothetical protein
MTKGRDENEFEELKLWLRKREMANRNGMNVGIASFRNYPPWKYQWTFNYNIFLLILSLEWPFQYTTFYPRDNCIPQSTRCWPMELSYSRSWALLEEPPIVQPLKNSAFYGTRRFNTLFKIALHWSLSWAISIQSTPHHPISLRSILILSTHLHVCLPSCDARKAN